MEEARQERDLPLCMYAALVCVCVCLQMLMLMLRLRYRDVVRIVVVRSLFIYIAYVFVELPDLSPG